MWVGRPTLWDMSEARPTPDQIDRCLDELANAYAQGRLSDTQFADRSAQVLSAERVGLLDEALADLRSRTQPPPVFQAAAFGAPGMVPQPRAPFPRRPQPLPAFRPQPGQDTRRRHMFVLGGAIAFVGFLGLASLGTLVWVSSHSSANYTSVERAAPPVLEETEFLTEGSEDPIHPHTGGAMSSIVITKTSVTVWGKPHGEPWQKTTIRPDGSVEHTRGDPGSNIFDNSEFVLSLLPDMVSETPRHLDTSAEVKQVTVIREKPDGPVRYVISTEDGGAVVWDAVDPVVVEIRPAK